MSVTSGAKTAKTATLSHEPGAEDELDQLRADATGRDAELAIVNEIIRSLEGAHNALLDIEELGDTELDRIRSRYMELARKAREQIDRGEADVGTPDVAAE